MFGKGIRRKMFLVGGAYAAWKYFFDPQEGPSRRAGLQEQVAALTGGAVKANFRVPAEEPLKEKIESEVLRRDEWPKGRVNINVAEGIVTIRGELDSAERIAVLEQEIRNISGVVDVENLVHLPSQPPPNKVDALEASRKAESEEGS